MGHNEYENILLPSSVPGFKKKKKKKFKDTMDGKLEHDCSSYVQNSVLSWRTVPLQDCPEFCVQRWLSPGLDNEGAEGLQTPATEEQLKDHAVLFSWRKRLL